MKIFVGLGNPGDQYLETRHNAGFVFLDRLVERPEIAPVEGAVKFSEETKFKALIAKVDFKGEKILLVKPQTFMNLSGQAVCAILDFYKLASADLIVVSDDIDLPLGYARIRAEGSSGGQKGLQNIIDKIGTDKFLRVRLGVNEIEGNEGNTTQKARYDATTFVLSKFNPREMPLFNLIIDKTINYVLPFLGSKEEIPAHSIEVSYDSLK